MPPVHLQVGHIQRLSLVQDRTHEMKTLSLKPLLFGKYQQVLCLQQSLIQICNIKWKHISYV